MRATLADISGQTGYSKSTISIALRNDPRLPAATRQAIQEVAKRLGYRPDPSLSVIAAARWRRAEGASGLTLACLLDSQTPAPRVLRAYLDAVAERATDLGYVAARFDLRAYPNPRALCRVLVQRGVRGVLVPPVYTPELLRDFDWSLFAGVNCGQGLWRPPYHVVNTDVFAAVQIALRECLTAGYRRIGAALFVHRYSADDDARRLGAAFLEIAHITSERAEILPLESAPEDRTAFLDWVSQKKPEAIVALHSGAARWLREAGYRIPQDIAVVCLGDTPPPELAHINPQLADVGRVSVEMLDVALRHNEIGPPARPRVVLVTPEWIPGPTLGHAAT